MFTKLQTAARDNLEAQFLFAFSVWGKVDLNPRLYVNWPVSDLQIVIQPIYMDY